MFALRRALVAALAIGLTRATVGMAECKPDTAVHQNRTLFNGIAALHFDYIGSSVTVNGASSGLFGADLGLAICRWPAYTLSLGGEGLADMVETSYIAPGSPDFHPTLSVDFASVALTRRWRGSSIFHPMVSLRAGSVDAHYSYFHTVAGRTETHLDGQSTTGFMAPSAGAEVSVFKYMTIYLTGGVRVVGHLDTPGLSNGLSGGYATFGMGFGKFR